MKTNIHFRPVRPTDEEFLFRLYASTRLDIALSNLPLQQKNRLMKQQFDLQKKHYDEHFPNADNLIIMLGGRSIGRFYVDRTDDEIRIVDIIISEEARGKGIGTRLLTELLDEARVADKPVRLHVLKQDRAMGLYQRLGFEAIAEKELHIFMEFAPISRIIM